METRLKETIVQFPFFCDILEDLDSAVYICDANGRLLYINNEAERLDGYTQEEICGRTVEEAYGLDERTSPLLIALTSERPVVDKTFRYNVNGREIYQICNARPIYLDGEKVGAYTIQKDVTQLMDVIEQTYLIYGNNNAKTGGYTQKKYNGLDKKYKKYAEPESTGIFSAIFQKEREEIVKALMENKGNVSKTARQLGMHRQSLIYRMKKYNIS